MLTAFALPLAPNPPHRVRAAASASWIDLREPSEAEIRPVTETTGLHVPTRDRSQRNRGIQPARDARRRPVSQHAADHDGRRAARGLRRFRIFPGTTADSPFRASQVFDALSRAVPPATCPTAARTS